MKYTRPEVEIMELDKIDVIQTSGEQGGIVPGENGTPVDPISTLDSKNVPTI